MTADEAWIVSIASLVAVSCAFVGVFLVLRGMAMLGDAISHSVLFGIVAAFLITGSRSLVIMLLGATGVGLFTAYMASVLNKKGQLHTDSSIGVTFTFLFAVGVILISAFAGQVDLDQDCVLHGMIEFSTINSVVLGGRDIGPRAFWILLVVTLANCIFVVVGFRKLKLLSFDPVLASSLGLNIPLWHYLLMSFVSLTTVASFESVGAILVVALLVVPANTAYLVARSLKEMLILAILASLAAVWLGFYTAKALDTSIAAAIATMSGAIFLLVVIGLGQYSFLSRHLSGKTTLSS